MSYADTREHSTANTEPKELYSDHQLSLKDLDIIRREYGNNIKDIFELGPGQEWMFQERKNNKSAFFLQMLLRAQMELIPEQFRNRVNKVCAEREALRFAYVSKGLDRPHCVELKKRNAEVIFRDLSSVDREEIPEKLEVLCEADRHRGFDLENDPLLRISVFKLADQNEYAFIISQPHINSDGTSIGFLIKDIFIDYVLGIDSAVETGGADVFKKVAAYRNSLNIQKELEYWKEYLQGATEEISLPGMIRSGEEFDERVYISGISKEMEEALRSAQKRYKVTFYNLMQAAWGVTLNRITGRSDILFGAITSGRDAQILQSMMIPGGFVRVLPVRIRLEDSMTFGEVVRNVQRDFAASMKYSHCTLDQIRKAIGREKPIFNHILNCHNFSGNQSMSGGMELPGFKIISGTAYDNLSEDLAIYIRQGDGRMELGIGYNGAVFTRETVELYVETYKKVLEQILSGDEELKIGEIESYDAAFFEYTAQLRQVANLKKTMLLRKSKVFGSIEWDELMSISDEAKCRTYSEEDVIFTEDAQLDSIPIVVSGYVELACRANDGWDNPVKICKPGSILSLSGIAGASRSETTAIAKSKETAILFVPSSRVRKWSEEYPQMNLELIKILYRESMDYKKMWVNF